MDFTQNTAAMATRANQTKRLINGAKDLHVHYHLAGDCRLVTLNSLLFTLYSFPLFPLNFRLPSTVTPDWSRSDSVPSPNPKAAICRDCSKMVDETVRKKFKPSDSIQMVTCQGPVNIAVIKYWGKRNEQRILPLNSSLSVTLDKKELHSITTVAASENFSEDYLWLNGRKHNVAEMPRIQKCLSTIRKLSHEEYFKNGEGSVLRDGHIHICSENNFPTAAGLASSAAGYSCLVFALSRLFQIHGDLSTIAR